MTIINRKWRMKAMYGDSYSTSGSREFVASNAPEKFACLNSCTFFLVLDNRLVKSYLHRLQGRHSCKWTALLLDGFTKQFALNSHSNSVLPHFPFQYCRRTRFQEFRLYIILMFCVQFISPDIVSS